MNTAQGACVFHEIGHDRESQIGKSVWTSGAITGRGADKHRAADPLQQVPLTNDDGAAIMTIGNHKTAFVRAAIAAGLAAGQNRAGDRLV